MTVASSSFTSTILPIAGVLATLLAGLGGAWAIYAVGVPRRKLLYGLRAVAQILPGNASDSSGKLELLHDGTAVAQPRVLSVQLTGRGSRDVPSTCFDNGAPIQIDVGARILAILHVGSEPASFIAPKVAFDETKLEIGPSLIGKNQKITFTLLTDGDHPGLNCQAALENVKLKPQQIRRLGGEVLFSAGIAGGLFIAAGSVGLAWATINTGMVSLSFNIDPMAAINLTFFAVTFATAIVGFLMAIFSLVLWKRSKPIS